MPFIATVLYPQREGATFDMKYYIDTHMPLVSRIWSPVGLEKWEVQRLDVGTGGEKPPFTVAALLTFKDEATWTGAQALPAAAEIFGDIPNFSSEQPVLFGGSVVATS
ncbi:hypothetical protein ACO1O0_007990 [Amphichorda felina]